MMSWCLLMSLSCVVQYYYYRRDKNLKTSQSDWTNWILVPSELVDTQIWIIFQNTLNTLHLLGSMMLLLKISHSTENNLAFQKMESQKYDIKQSLEEGQISRVRASGWQKAQSTLVIFLALPRTSWPWISSSMDLSKRLLFSCPRKIKTLSSLRMWKQRNRFEPPIWELNNLCSQKKQNDARATRQKGSCH